MRSPDEICGTFNAVKKEGSAPRRTRNLSLDEEVLTKHVAQVAFPVAKARGVNFKICYFMFMLYENMFC